MSALGIFSCLRIPKSMITMYGAFGDYLYEPVSSQLLYAKSYFILLGIFWVIFSIFAKVVLISYYKRYTKIHNLNKSKLNDEAIANINKGVDRHNY